MNKFIIHNHSSQPDHIIMKCVAEVIAEGKISNYGRNYCYCTAFAHPRVLVFATKNAYSDTFRVEDSKT